MNWMTKAQNVSPAQTRQRALWFSGILAGVGFLLLAIAVVGLGFY